MELRLPVAFGECSEGQRINLVGKLRCWDPAHEVHWLSSVSDGASFIASGLLDGSGEVYSLLNVEFRKQFPIPVVCLDEKSVSFKHHRPSWESMHEVLELCSGFGGMTQGLLTAGFHTVATVEFNERFLDLYKKQGDADQVHGDVTMLSTLVELQKISRGAGTLAAGFACQPFSRLGDEKGGNDVRALCLRGILACAFYLQVSAIVLECVQPAAVNSYGENEIELFLKMSGFHCVQHDYNLHEIWLMRRSRAWWLLTSPLIGKTQLYDWPKLQVVTKVRHVIPKILPWDISDEEALSLNEIEQEAFGIDTGGLSKYLLNMEGCAPCALHSWGSQVLACQCGCRLAGLSAHRLREKGLFGCLVRSCPTDNQECILRHIHPNEVMMRCGFDPIIDFGTNPRLTLAAAGQMASPIQACWIFSTLEEHIQKLKGIKPDFGIDLQLQAYMTWVLMRGRQVWPTDLDYFGDSNFNSLIGFWQQVSHLSLHELMHPQRWPELRSQPLTIASVLDALIRRSQSAVPAGVCEPIAEDVSPDVPMIVFADPSCDDTPTPWHVPDEKIHEYSPCDDFCTVVFQHEDHDPIRFIPTDGTTIQQFMQAHVQLTGECLLVSAKDQKGDELSMTHVLQPGQVICVRCTVPEHPTSACLSAPDESAVSVGFANSCPRPSDLVPQVCHDVTLDDVLTPPDPMLAGCDRAVTCEGLSSVACCISPTAVWTCPVHAEQDEPAPVPTDITEKVVFHANAVAHESWISAAPLLGLNDVQFLNLKPPSVVVNKHLEALRNQMLSATDRAVILHNQAGVWSDDEFCHHIELILRIFQNGNFAGHMNAGRKFVMLDPLLLTGWANHGTNWCHAWARSHPDIRAQGVEVLTACMLDGHWIPVVLHPVGQVLHFSTWDAPMHSHEKVNHVIEVLSQCLGFQRVSILRHHRLFFSSDKCGALAMSFLHQSVFHSMLPSNADEADMVHQRLRAVYLRFVESSSVVHRPWVWGTGEDGDEPFPNEPGQSSDAPVTAERAPAGVPVLDVGFSHQCISREKRMELLTAKGKLWGDDEIRYHIKHMIDHPKNITRRNLPTVSGFVMMDPLLLSTWDTIGPALCEAWCRRNQEVYTKGFHVVAVFLHRDHWFPVWMVPHGQTLVVHVIDDPWIDYAILMPMLDILK